MLKDAPQLRHQLINEGYCHLPGIAPDQLIEASRQAADRAAEEMPQEQKDRQRLQGSLINVWDHPQMAPLIGLPNAIEALEALGFPNPKFYTGFIISKPPKKAPALFWHQDTMANYLAEYQPVVPAIKSVWGSDKISGITSGADVFPTLAAEAEKVGNFRENWVRGTYAHENWLEWFRVMRAKLGDRAMKGGEDPVKMMAELEKDGTAALQREI